MRISRPVLVAFPLLVVACGSGRPLRLEDAGAGPSRDAAQDWCSVFTTRCSWNPATQSFDRDCEVFCGDAAVDVRLGR